MQALCEQNIPLVLFPNVLGNKYLWIWMKFCKGVHIDKFWLEIVAPILWQALWELWPLLNVIFFVCFGWCLEKEFLGFCWICLLFDYDMFAWDCCTPFCDKFLRIMAIVLIRFKLTHSWLMYALNKSDAWNQVLIKIHCWTQL